METEAFKTFLDRHGSDPSKWPASGETNRVNEFLRESEYARRVLHETQDLHGLLETALHVREPFGLEARILKAVHSENENWWSGAVAQWILRPALVALPLLVGFIVGLAATDSSLVVENELTIAQFDDHSDLLAIADE